MGSESKRDKNGRWLPGSSGNNDGRPRRKPRADMSNITAFANYFMEANIKGEPRRVTHHEVILMKLFESAAKGSVRAQIYLHQIFENADQERAGLRLEMDRFLRDCDREYEEKGDLRDVSSERFHVMEMAVKAIQAPYEGEPYPRKRKGRRKK